ncbi:unnamed protein product, partial [Mesorhabditis spiculigera]
MHAMWLLLFLFCICRIRCQEEDFLFNDYDDDDPAGRRRRESNIKADVLKKNFFEKFIAAFRDPDTHPCDNFYRHICPISIQLNDTYYGQVKAHAKQSYEKLERMSGFYDTLGVMQQDREGFLADPEQELGRKTQDYYGKREIRKGRHEDLATLSEEWTTAGYIFEQTWMIPHRVQYLTESLQRVYAKNDRLPKIAKNLQAQMLKLVETFSREPNYEELYARHLQYINETSFFFGMVDETFNQLGNLRIISEEIKKFLEFFETFSREPNYEELYRQHVDAINELTIFFAMVDEALEQIDGLKALIDVTRQTFEHLKQLLAVGLRRIGSSNSGRYVSMSIWELMPVLVNPGADPAIAYGSTGWVMAHEYMHAMPYFNNPSDWPKPVPSRPSEICIVERASRACQLWPEKDCFSGLHTFLEDRSDFTGLRIAWEAFMVEVREQWGHDGDQLKRLVYPDLGVTREQLFFYAQAIPYCSTYDRSQHIVGSKGRDVHSAHRIRVNMMHSNMEEFAGWQKPDAFHICIASYNTVMMDLRMFKRKHWQYMVLDEAHNIKNFKSMKWQALLTMNADHRLLLTGEMAIDEGGFTPDFFKQSSNLRDLFKDDLAEDDLPICVDVPQDAKAFEKEMAAVEEEQDTTNLKIARDEAKAETAEFALTAGSVRDTQLEELSQDQMLFRELITRMLPIERYALRQVEADTAAYYDKQTVQAMEEERKKGGESQKVKAPGPSRMPGGRKPRRMRCLCASIQNGFSAKYCPMHPPPPRTPSPEPPEAPPPPTGRQSMTVRILAHLNKLVDERVKKRELRRWLHRLNSAVRYDRCRAEIERDFSGPSSSKLIRELGEACDTIKDFGYPRPGHTGDGQEPAAKMARMEPEIWDDLSAEEKPSRLDEPLEKVDGVEQQLIPPIPRKRGGRGSKRCLCAVMRTGFKCRVCPAHRPPRKQRTPVPDEITSKKKTPARLERDAGLTQYFFGLPPQHQVALVKLMARLQEPYPDEIAAAELELVDDTMETPTVEFPKEFLWMTKNREYFEKRAAPSSRLEPVSSSCALPAHQRSSTSREATNSPGGIYGIDRCSTSSDEADEQLEDGLELEPEFCCHNKHCQSGEFKCFKKREREAAAAGCLADATLLVEPKPVPIQPAAGEIPGICEIDWDELMTDLPDKFLPAQSSTSPHDEATISKKLDAKPEFLPGLPGNNFAYAVTKRCAGCALVVAPDFDPANYTLPELPVIEALDLPQSMDPRHIRAQCDHWIKTRKDHPLMCYKKAADMSKPAPTTSARTAQGVENRVLPLFRGQLRQRTPPRRAPSIREATPTDSKPFPIDDDDIPGVSEQTDEFNLASDSPESIERVIVGNRTPAKPATGSHDNESDGEDLEMILNFDDVIANSPVPEELLGDSECTGNSGIKCEIVEEVVVNRSPPGKPTPASRGNESDGEDLEMIENFDDVDTDSPPRLIPMRPMPRVFPLAPSVPVAPVVPAASLAPAPLPPLAPPPSQRPAVKLWREQNSYALGYRWASGPKP